MYIYRAINELDRQMKPMENGIISRSIYDEIMKPAFDFLVYATFRNENEILNKMTEQELNSIYRNIRNNMSLSLFSYEIIKYADKNQKELNENIIDIIKSNGENIESSRKILSYLATKNGHIAHGNTNDYPWISFSTDYRRVKSFYDCQEEHRIAVVDSNIKMICDICNDDYLLALDLSNENAIKNNNFLINEDFTKTALNYRGLNYAKSSSEVIYYNRVPKEKIVTILKTLEYELLLLGILDEEYLKLPITAKSYIKMEALTNIKKLIKNREYMFEIIYREHFIKSHSLEKIAKDNKVNLETLKVIKEIIIGEIKKDQEFKSKVKVY